MLGVRSRGRSEKVLERDRSIHRPRDYVQRWWGMIDDVSHPGDPCHASPGSARGKRGTRGKRLRRSSYRPKVAANPQSRSIDSPPIARLDP